MGKKIAVAKSTTDLRRVKSITKHARYILKSFVIWLLKLNFVF